MTSTQGLDLILELPHSNSERSRFEVGPDELARILQVEPGHVPWEGVGQGHRQRGLTDLAGTDQADDRELIQEGMEPLKMPGYLENWEWRSQISSQQSAVGAQAPGSASFSLAGDPL